MTPEQAAIGLLRAGALSRFDFLLHTGWTPEKAQEVLAQLVEQGLVVVQLATCQYDEIYWLREQLPAWVKDTGRKPDVLRAKPRGDRRKRG